MWVKWLIIGILFVSLMGCGMIRSNIIDIINEDTKNVEMSREVALKLLKTWGFSSGMIRGSLMSKSLQLPAEVLKAMDELDTLARKYYPLTVDLQKLDFDQDQELGRSVGYRIVLLTKIVGQALSIYAPELLKFVPMGL